MSKYEDYIYIDKIAEEFSYMNKETAVVHKCRRQCTYKELYNDMKDRHETLNKVKDLLVEFRQRDIIPYTNECSSTAANFMTYIYSEINSLPNKNYIKYAKAIIKAIEDGLEPKGDFENSLTTISRKLGLSSNYLGNLKRNNEYKYNLIMSFDEDEYKSCLLFKEHYELLIENFINNRNNKLVREKFYSFTSKEKQKEYWRFINIVTENKDVFRLRNTILEKLNKLSQIVNYIKY